MTSLVWRFGLYNLLPGLVIGTLAWLAIYAATNLAKIEYVPLRLPLLYVSLLKSSLLLLGISSFNFLPEAVPRFLNIQPIPPYQVLPFFLLWGGSILIVQSMVARHTRRQVLLHTVASEQGAPRLAFAMDRVLEVYRQLNCAQINLGWVCCEIEASLPHPKLLVSKDLSTPLITLTGGDPVIVFPLDLANHLNDAELERALAHEFAHLALHSPAWCTPSVLAQLIAINPIAWFSLTYLRREEEVACDDIAITALGQPDMYVEMLVKSYRFAAGRPRAVKAQVSRAYRLLNHQPALSTRVRRLLQPHLPGENLDMQRLAACLLWVGVLIFLFV